MAIKLKIGGHSIKLVLSPLEETDDCGETDYVTSTITVSSLIGKSQKEATLIHEALHVMNTTMDHTLLDSIAEQMYQFLKDNDLLNQKRFNELLK